MNAKFYQRVDFTKKISVRERKCRENNCWPSEARPTCVRYHYRYTPLKGIKGATFFVHFPKTCPKNLKACAQLTSTEHQPLFLSTTTKDLSYYSVLLVLNFSHFFCPLTTTTKDHSFYSVLLVLNFSHFFCPLLLKISLTTLSY